MSPKRVLILGIGNILLRDEGIGVRVIEALQGEALPDDVEAVDGGTSGADLIDTIADRPKVIVIDAVGGDKPPGTIYRMRPEDLMGGPPAMSLHELGLLEMLQMAGQMGCAPNEVVIFGVRPSSIEPGVELTETIKATIPRIIALVMDEAKN